MQNSWLLKLFVNIARLVVLIFAIIGLLVLVKALSTPEEKLALGCYQFEDIVACGEVDRLCVRGVKVPLDCRPSWRSVDVVMMDVTAEEQVILDNRFDPDDNGVETVSGASRPH